MAMTLDEIAAVVNAAFPAGAQQFGAALALLDARMGVEMAQGVQRLAQALSDRLAGIVAWWNGDPAWMTTAAEVRQALRDLLDATTVAT